LRVYFVQLRICSTWLCTRTSTVFAVFDVALHECKMVLVTELGAMRVQVESIAEVRRHLDHLLALHQAFAVAAILDQGLDGADLQAMRFREGHQALEGEPWCRLRS